MYLHALAGRPLAGSVLNALPPQPKQKCQAAHDNGRQQDQGNQLERATFQKQCQGTEARAEEIVAQNNLALLKPRSSRR